MSQGEAFEKMLAENPFDHATHGVYADWLEEQGHPDAEFHRWLWQSKHAPHSDSSGAANWYKQNEQLFPGEKKPDELPPKVFEQLDRASTDSTASGSWWSGYRNKTAALDALKKAYHLSQYKHPIPFSRHTPPLRLSRASLLTARCPSSDIL